MADVARYYDESKNDGNASLPGVPLADVSQEDFDSYPEWLQQSIDAAPFYRKTRPSTASKRDKADSESEESN